MLMKRHFTRLGKLQLICLMLIAGCGTALASAAQPGTVTGTVTDHSGPIPGVSVLVKNSGQGTSTDADGKYSIYANPGDTLIFRMLGYEEQRIAVMDQAVMNVLLLTSAATMKEVVVVGYGTQSRRNVTGSVSKVDMQDTETLPNINVTQAIRGRVAGVQFIDNGRPGQNGSILIRGPRSLSGGNNPLIVLDGIFFNGSLAEISPNDIESMEVLKDASAAAIYGSRAANGVILITSKKGTTEKPSISINAFYGISDWSYKPTLLSPERYIQKVLDYRSAAGLPSDPDKILDYLTPTEARNYEAGKTIDPYDLVSQAGSMSSYDINVSGRTKLTNYYLSTSLSDEQGLILNDQMKRLSFRANIENQITDWLKIGLNSTYMRRDYSGRKPESAYSVSPYGTAYHEDGAPTYYLVPEDQISGNPIRNALLSENDAIFNNIFANFYALVNLPFIEGLTYRLNYSPNYRWEHLYTFFRQDKHLNSNTTSASKFNREDLDWVVENILTYKKQINRDHAFDITLLYGRNHSGFEETSANSSQLSTDALGWNELGLGSILTNSSSAGVTDGVSSMFRVNYRFKERYLATFTVRRDGSSVFAANNKYATFPSGAFAWLISDEPFMKSASKVNMLKFRISYGAVGNQAISPYQSLSLSSINRYVFGDGGSPSLGVYPSSMANQDLRWETTYTANAAIDFELFKGRLGGTFEVYNMDTKDLLVRRTLPIMTGYQSVWTNLGAVNNKGIELTLNTVNLKKKEFEWNSTVTLSVNRNKIVHLYRSDTDGDGKEDDDLGNDWFIGQPMNVAYDYVFDGIYQEGDELPSGYQPGYVRLKDLNSDGQIDAANDRRIVGQMGQPKYRWGLANTFRYKNLSLSVFINAMQGWLGTANELDIQYFLPGSGNFPNRPVNRLDAGWWTPENKSTTRPSLVYPNPFLHNYYVSRNFIRIQDISLSYDINRSVLNKLKLSNARVYLSGKNIATFTRWLGTDPESGGSSRSFPIPRTITAGINVGF